MRLMRNPMMNGSQAYPAMQSTDMRLMRNPTMNPMLPSQGLGDLVVATQRLAAGSKPADGGLAAALDKYVAGSRPSLPPLASSVLPDVVKAAAAGPSYRGPFVPSGRDLGSMPDFDQLGQTLGIKADQVFDPYTTLLEEAEGTAQPYPAPSRDRPVDPRIVQTMLGEAANQGDLGIAAVAQTIMNRSQKNPDNIIDPVDVVLRDRQYSTWNAPGNGGNNPQKYQPGTELYERAEDIWRDVRDNAADFTFGATHYRNPDIASPSWAEPNVPGTERLYDDLLIGDHGFLPRVAPGDRANMNSNPALSERIAAGGIGPNAPVPRDRPAGLGGRTTGIAYTASGKPIDPDTGYLMEPNDPRLNGIRAAGVPVQRDTMAMPAYAGGLSDQIVVDRLRPDVNGRGQSMPLLADQSHVVDPRTGQLVSTRQDKIPTYGDATMGGPDGPMPANARVGIAAAAPTGASDRVRAAGKTPEPTLWDNTVSGMGDAFSHTLVGGAIKAIFPEFWDGFGDTMKGNGTAGSARTSNDGTSSFSSLESNGGGGGKTGETAYGESPAPAPGYGIGMPPAYAPPGMMPNIWWPQLNMPDLGYNPGIDAEWDYYPAFADGGLVPDAQSEALPATSGFDPRLVVIMNAEDALRGQHPDPEAALSEFIEQFGAKALEQLKERISMGTLDEDGPRMIQGPGGPTEDLVPAVIDGNQPAKLSNGEFVVPAAAVAAAGDGDPMAGAERLTQLSQALGG